MFREFHINTSMEAISLHCDGCREIEQFNDISIFNGEELIHHVPMDRMLYLSKALSEGQAGHFHNHLYKAWQKADLENSRSLMFAFPEFTVAAMHATGYFNQYLLDPNA